MDSIGFPNLGLFFPHVGQVIRIGSFTIAYYGVIVALGMMAGVSLIMRIAKKTGQDPDIYFNFSLAALAVGIIGARVYYVIFSWDYYKQHLLEIINFRGGGLAIYGGVIAGILTAAVYSGRKHIPLLRLLDTVFPGVALGQAIGRWGNFFNREAFGRYTDNLLAMQLPLDAVSADTVTSEMLEHAAVRDGIKMIQVHPTFFYESVWNLCLTAVLLVLVLRWKRRKSGQVFCVYLLGYGLGRLWIEGLRTDQLLWPGTHFPVSQILSGILAAAALAVLAAGSIRSD